MGLIEGCIIGDDYTGWVGNGVQKRHIRMGCDEYESESMVHCSNIEHVWELNFDVSINTRHCLNRKPVIGHTLSLQLEWRD